MKTFIEYLTEQDQDHAAQKGMMRAKAAVGAGANVRQAEKGLDAGAEGQRAGGMQAKAMQPYMASLKKILSDPKLTMRFKALAKMAQNQ